MRIKFNELGESNLIKGAVYEGGTSGNISDDVISKIIKCGNSGGFRQRGTTDPFELSYVALFSTLQEAAWMNEIDEDKGIFVYYGDNNTPGTEIIDTKKKGNLILRTSFELLDKGQRNQIPPFLIFTKEIKRNVTFKGLAVPRKSQTLDEETLEIKERKVNGKLLRNYKAWFDILNVDVIDKRWLKCLEKGDGYNSEYAPELWVHWIDTGDIVSTSYKDKGNKIAESECADNKMQLLEELEQQLEGRVRGARKCKREERLDRISGANKMPMKIQVKTTFYNRNADVIAEVLERANGECEKCEMLAPFLSAIDKTPYLEIHYKLGFEEGGKDTIENAIEVCPNCYIKLKHGI